MCGICGYANFTSQVDEKFIHPMMDKLTHRGPDDSGFFKNENVCIGHRRLSIIDLTSGHQPIFNEDKSIAVVQNGEFYNFTQERNELIEKGHTFYTKSDAEIFVHLYEEQGLDAVKSLEGMYAAALYDRQKELLILCRDRLGQKPLYYSITGKEVIFSSELKSLITHPSVSKAINTKSLKKYFFYDYIPGEDTIYSNVYKLPAAYVLTVNLKTGEVDKKPYWDIPLFNRNKDPYSFEAAQENLKENLKNAVNKRLRSDVPLGILLSGGIDSSVIAQLSKELLSNRPPKTFSIGYNENSYDESFYSSLLAKHLDSEHYHFCLTEDKALETLHKVKGTIDEPFADPSIIPTYFLAENTRKLVTVALGGDGSDELFAGYQAFPLVKTYWPMRGLRSPLKHLLTGLSFLTPTKDSYSSASYCVNRFRESLSIENTIIQMISLFGSFSLNEIQTLTNDTSPDFETQVLEEITDHLTKRKDEHYISQMQYCLAKLYLGEGVLVKVDRASMANSLEVRSPFLDHHLFKDVFEHFPVDLRLKGFKTKHIFKETFKNSIPSEIITRPKKGFAMPLATWIKTAFKDEIRQMLEPARIKKQGLVNDKYVARILDEHFTGKMDHRKKIWSLLIMQYWLDNS